MMVAGSVAPREFLSHCKTFVPIILLFIGEFTVQYGLNCLAITLCYGANVFRSAGTALYLEHLYSGLDHTVHKTDGLEVLGRHYATYPEAFTALAAGTVDAVICETPVANDFLASSQGGGFCKVVMEGNDDFIVSVSIGISKNADASFKERLNSALGKISQSDREALMNSVAGA